MNLLVLLILCQGYSYEKGLEILNIKGAEAAVAYFDEGAKTLNDPLMVFGLAWSLWRQGEDTRAEKACRWLLSDKPTPTPSSDVHAKANYLLGYILLDENPKEGVEFLGQARRLYQYLDDDLALFQTHMGLAYGNFLMEKRSEVDKNLDLAHEINRIAKLNQNLGFYYSLQSRIAFKDKDIQGALDLARFSRKEYKREGNNEEELSAMISEALFLSFLGQYADARDLCKKIDRRSQNTKMTKFYVYNQVNWIRIYHCHDQNFTDRVDYVRDWLKSNNDEELQEQLDLVLTTPCT